MRCSNLGLLTTALFVASVAPAAPTKSPYTDLLPVNMTVQQATDRLDPQLLKRSILAVIPTSRFLKQTKRWQKWFGATGTEKTPGWGVNRESARITATAMDPRRVIDTGMTQFEPRFGTVKVFDDLASAREGGAQYFLLIDYDLSISASFMGVGGGAHGYAGGMLLNPGFQRVFEMAVDKATPWYSEPLLGGSNSSMMALAKSTDGNFVALLPAFSAAINGAFAERGAPMPVVAPPPPAPITAAAPAPAAAPAAPPERDAAYESRLELAANAGELYALGDEMAEKGDKAKASQAFRAILTRFPDNALAAKAADRLAAPR